MSEVEGQKKRAIEKKKDKTFFLCDPVQDSEQVVLILKPCLPFSVVSIAVIGHSSFFSFVVP